MLEIYQGLTRIGIIIANKGCYSARDARGDRIGTYGDKESAVAALLKAREEEQGR